MSTNKHIDKICCVVLVLTLLITVLFVNAEHFGVRKVSAMTGYETRLFDTSYVHSIDIVMDDWDDFLETCRDEEYSGCTVVIDGEAYKNVAIRAKGNTSLTQVESYGNSRYSFKIEFDHYDNANTYYGLDKLCLNNVIQDNTYMKDYLTYQMMAGMRVASPLCSYVNITVNDELWGLYLAVEGVEESFLRRIFGNDYGDLYKPDSMDMGGGRGNGKDFDMEGWEDAMQNGIQMPDSTMQNGNQMPGNSPPSGFSGNMGGMAGNPPGGTPRDATTESPGGIPQDALANPPGGIPQDATAEPPDGIPQDALANPSNGTPRNTPGNGVPGQAAMSLSLIHI